MAELEKLRAKARALPLLPGVYIMKNTAGKIIYIGKAKKLKNRVSQYFQSPEKHPVKVYKMVMQVADFDYIVCDSEFEALILECSMIKQHQPKYNILLKDDKGYSYIRITKGDWPRIQAVKSRTEDGATYLGPYNSFFVVRNTVDEALKIFKLPSCGRSFPKDFGKARPCLNKYIDNCMGVCTGKISQAEYNEAFHAAVQFIKGGAGSSAALLERQMQEAAAHLEFERAARIRDRIRALERRKEKQKVITCSEQRVDVMALAKTADTYAIQVFVFRKGRLEDLDAFTFPIMSSPAEIEADFIKQYYQEKTDIPPKIYIDSEPEDCALLQQWLSEKRGKKMEILVPKISDNKALVEMCRRNASELLAKERGISGNTAAALDELARLLGLEGAPEYIEAYDISHTAGNENVGGMVTFLMGEPLKSGYRKFKIQTVAGQDDFHSMAEVLDRRFTEYYAQRDSGTGFGRLPDLLLLDGGTPQLNAVRPIMEKHKITVPVFGMVKDSKHKTSAIASAGGTIAIKSNRRAYTLLTTIQDEVHRFAIGYHHRRAGKKALQSRLLSIPGIGEKKAERLLKAFKTLKKIAEASAEELSALPSISKADAKNIQAFFRENGNL
ncbi:MAG: excinuclease ABC subunit UvrC [Clostridia bacterium]|nr:excinuclease ABC subunit UvrC [Clostridia bacterium]